MKTCRKILSLALALVLCAVLVVPAGADAWIPPDDHFNYYVQSLPYNSGSCAALNAFLSNYAEANLQHYDSETSDAAVNAMVLKHLELNAGLFGNQVAKVVGEDGRIYMKIAAECFEDRMWKMFDRSIPAQACPGYEDGYITVTAENFGGPIQVFASARDCVYLGNYVYQVWFDVFYVNQNFSNWYGTCYNDLPINKLSHMGSGEALFRFDGSTEQSGFTSTDFSLAWFDMDAPGIPCTNANEPYMPAPQTEPTQPPAAETEPPVAETEPPISETETSEPEQTKATQPKDDRDDRSPYRVPDMGIQWGRISRALVLIAVLVVAIAVIALVIILLLFRRRR